MRLDKYLEQAQVGSRKTVKRLLVSQQVRVAGAVVGDPAFDVESSFMTVTVSGQEITGQSHVYYLLNKPQGAVSAVTDQEHQTVIELLAKKDQRPGVFPVGRLDRDTEGLLLLTNNGKLGYQLLQPLNQVEKEYEAIVNETVTATDINAFQQGIVFHGGYQCLPAVLKIKEERPEGTRVSVTITEGKFHQVKKMFLAVGKKVIYLKRVKMGSLRLDDSLATGQYRPLSLIELKELHGMLASQGGKK